MENFVAVIMAGGEGQRFWPLSTAEHPKQFLDLEKCGRSLLQATFDRLLPTVAGPQCLFVATGARYAELVRQQLPLLPRGNLLIEPMGRDTAPCVALSALTLRTRFGNVVMGLFPADHRIGDVGTFQGTLGVACETAEATGAIVTLGVRPDRPSTAYGYIQRGRAIGAAYDVVRFVEKPDRARAEEYLASGTYSWNSGMFLWTVDTILSELRRYAPEVLEPLERAVAAGRLREVFGAVPKTSIDYAVMEKTSNVLVLPVDFAWDDIGDWEALGRLLDKGDGEQDTVVGRYVGMDTSDNIVYTDDGDLVAALGVHDLVIVKRLNTVLLVPRDRVQDLKKLLKDDRLSIPFAAEAEARPQRAFRGRYRRYHRPGRRRQKALI